MMPTIAAQQVSSPQPRASRCHAAFTRSSSCSSPLKTCGDATTTATSSSFPVHHEDVWNAPSSNNFVAQLSTGPRPRPGAPHVALPFTSCAAPAEGAGRSYLTSSCFPPRWSTMTTVSPMYAAPSRTRHDEADDDDDEPRLHHFGSRAAPHRGMEEMALRRSSLDEISKDLPQVEGSAASTWSSTWRLYSHTNTSSSSSEPSTIATPTKAARADDDGAVLVAWRSSVTTNQHLHNNVKDEVDAVAHDDAIPGVMAPAARRVLLSPPKEDSLHECFSECRVAPSNACRRHLHLRHKDPTTCHEDVEMHACFFGCDESDELLLPRTEAMTAYLQAYYAAQLNLRHLPRVHVPPLHLHKKEGHVSSENAAQPELAGRLRVGGPVVLISPARDEPMPVRCTARGRAEVMDDEVQHDVGTPSLTAAEQEHLNAMGWF